MNKTANSIPQKLALYAIYASAAATFASLVFIVGYILICGLPHITATFLTDIYKPGLDHFGILPMIISTLMLVGLTLILATPIGIMAAIYMTEYAKDTKTVRFIRFMTESLAGIPSIIYGLFGFAAFVTFAGLGFSILSGALTVAVMVLPTVIRTTEEALKSVPKGYREASLALGAGKLATIFKVVLPNALRGILSGIILSVGRIVGETAAIVYTMGSAANIPDGFMSSGRTLSVHLYFLAKEGLDINQSFASAAVLLILVAVINACTKLVAKSIKR